MAKLTHLAAFFLFGCVGSGFIAFIGATHPVMKNTMWIIYALVAMLWLTSLFTDDAIIYFLKLNPERESVYYYAVLIAIALAIFLGGIAEWLLPG